MKGTLLPETAWGTHHPEQLGQDC